MTRLDIFNKMLKKEYIKSIEYLQYNPFIAISDSREKVKLDVEVSKKLLSMEDATFMNKNFGAKISDDVRSQRSYWLFRVKLSEEQAIVAFPKFFASRFFTLCIGFEKETVMDVNLPYTRDADEIFERIRFNKRYNSISNDNCISAIKLLQKTISNYKKLKETLGGESPDKLKTYDKLIRRNNILDRLNPTGNSKKKTKSQTRRKIESKPEEIMKSPDTPDNPDKVQNIEKKVEMNRDINIPPSGIRRTGDAFDNVKRLLNELSAIQNRLDEIKTGDGQNPQGSSLKTSHDFVESHAFDMPRPAVSKKQKNLQEKYAF